AELRRSRRATGLLPEGLKSRGELPRSNAVAERDPSKAALARALARAADPVERLSGEDTRVGRAELVERALVFLALHPEREPGVALDHVGVVGVVLQDRGGVGL